MPLNSATCFHGIALELILNFQFLPSCFFGSSSVKIAFEIFIGCECENQESKEWKLVRERKLGTFLDEWHQLSHEICPSKERLSS